MSRKKLVWKKSRVLVISEYLKRLNSGDQRRDMATLRLNLNRLEKALDRGGYHLGCVLGIHDFNKRRICRKCKFVEAKPKTNQP